MNIDMIPRHYKHKEKSNKAQCTKNLTSRKTYIQTYIDS